MDTGTTIAIVWFALGVPCAFLSYGLTLANSGQRWKAWTFAALTFLAPPSVLYELLFYRHSGLRFR